MRFSRQVSLAMAVRLVAVASSVGASVLIARNLGAAALGIYAVLSLTVSSLVQVMGSGLASANVYFGKQDPRSVNTITANSLIYSFTAGVAGSVAVYGVFLLEPQWFKNVPAPLMLIMLCTLPFQIWTLLGINIVLALGDVKRFNLLDGAAQTLLLVNSFIVFIILGKGLDRLVEFTAAAVAIFSIAVVGLVVRQAGRANSSASFRPDLRVFWRIFGFGTRVNIINAAMVLILRADVLLVNYFRGEAEAGVYSVAAQCSLLIMMFPNVVGTMLFPSVAGMATGSGEFTARVLRHTALVLLLLAAVSIPAAYALPVFFGPDFSPATLQFLILLPGAVMMGVQMMLSQHLVGIGKLRALPIFWLGSLALSVSLNLLLIPRYGANGAALVSTLTYGTIFGLTLVYFQKQTRQRLSELFVLRRGEMRAIFSRSGW